ncbi:hypothetical protein [Mycolicibacter longobardus]|uniref:Uncharacterized protein n=1 Tax=Mycolicibacter longobardus TaxID=1108812 RepID=A0A1X1YP96_9MYCO|nr:hypothetical protein [Mycolicibacter longobardus]ORW12882.1 hypothetical protein AWC16_06985 [Mycolicibacter longobardus]
MPDWIASGSHLELRFGWSKEQTAAVADALGLDATMTEDMRHVTAMMVRDIVVNWQTRGKETFYSRSRDFYSDMPRRYRTIEFLSYHYVTGVSDWLASRGYITQTLGKRNPGPGGDSYRTFAKPTPVLLDLVTGLIDVAEPRMAEKTPELIILRDEGGKSVDYDDTEETRRMRAEMVEINARMRALCRPRLDGREVQMPWLVRIFNVDFDHGGRLYFKGNSSQNMPKVDRRRVEVEIDDALHTTTELDYSTLHLALGYAEEGERRPRQPYEIKGFSRDEVKVATNVAINAPSELSAIRAIAMDQAEKERKSHPTRTDLAHAHTVYRRLTRKHWRARNLIGSGAGLRLQRIDSDIAVQVMLSMLRQDIPVLPIHDSFLVATHHQEELWMAMASAAKARGYDLEIHGEDNTFRAQAITHPGVTSTNYLTEVPRPTPHRPYLPTGGYCSDQHLYQGTNGRLSSEPSGKTRQKECSGTDPPRWVYPGLPRVLLRSVGPPPGSKGLGLRDGEHQRCQRAHHRGYARLPVGWPDHRQHRRRDPSRGSRDGLCHRRNTAPRHDARYQPHTRWCRVGREPPRFRFPSVRAWLGEALGDASEPRASGIFPCRRTLFMRMNVCPHERWKENDVTDELNAMTATQYKTYENRLRRVAARQGLRLEKSRLRDHRAVGYGTYQLVDVASNTLVSYSGTNGYGLGLDDIATTLYE